MSAGFVVNSLGFKIHVEGLYLISPSSTVLDCQIGSTCTTVGIT